jgi:hypothetical protein
MDEPWKLSIRQFDDLTGSISVLEVGKDIPFEVKRAYFLHNLKSDAERGGHAHKQLWQVIIPVSGSFRLSLISSNSEFVYDLESPETGVVVPPMWWRDLSGFSEGAVCLVLASSFFSESDYIRDFSSFLSQAGDLDALQ